MIFKPTLVFYKFGVRYTRMGYNNIKLSDCYEEATNKKYIGQFYIRCNFNASGIDLESFKELDYINIEDINMFFIYNNCFVIYPESEENISNLICCNMYSVNEFIIKGIIE